MAWPGQPNFAPPPGINFNAPVIRLGGGGGGRGGGNSGGEGRGPRMGMGGGDPQSRNLDRQRQEVRESMMALQPPTREEVARTIFIGGLGEGTPGDDVLQDLLACAGKLRRWTRAKDADDKKCKFGFAEYEDVESLEAAAEIFKDVQVPLFSADGSVQKDEEGDVKKAPLLMVVDQQSREYIDQWKGRKKEDDNARQFRIQSCQDELQQSITTLINHGAHSANGVNTQNGEMDGDIRMGEDGEDGAQVVNIPLTLEDELADIPAEMRATVAEEIKAFRDRSNRRDIERLRREEEVEQEERRRTGAAPRTSRLASPPPSTSAANGIPVGPRGQQGVQGAPSGPKGFRGAQIPSDYVNGVAFVPGAGPNGQGVTVSLNREDEDAEESDEELERRRQEKKNADLDRQFHEHVRRWQNRERARGAAQEREKKREEEDKRLREKAKRDMLVRLAEWNDDEEADKGRHLYYRDRSTWLRQRERDRDLERREDDLDRKAEEREKAEERRRENEALGKAADQAADFLGSMQAPESKEATGPAPFKISLGGASAKTKQTQAAAPARRTMADVLEDEEDAAAAGNRRPELKPLQDTSTLPTSGQDLTEEEKSSARQQLASEIPTDTDALFSHPIKWNSLSSSLLDVQIRPFVERKVVEYLGVQEDLIVDAVLDGIKARKEAKSLVEELEGPLEQESEVLVKKVWRLLVFWGECESRGLSQ